MFDEELNTLQAEAYDHLWNGRFRLALTVSEKVYQSRPDDSEAAICYAWALLENGNPVKAMEYANLSVELKGDSIKARVYRAYLLYRMSIFEGALADTDQSIDKQKEILAWTYLNRARSYAGLQKFDEANNSIELALIIDNGKNPLWKDLRSWIEKANKLYRSKNNLSEKYAAQILDDSIKALKSKEYWFTLLSSRMLLEKFPSEEAQLLELEAMLYLFQLKPALKKAEQLENKFRKNDRFQSIYNSLKKISKLEQQYDVPQHISKKSTKEKVRSDFFTESNFKTDSIYYPNDYVKVNSLKLFDAVSETSEGSKRYNKTFGNYVSKVGAEIILENLFFKKTDQNFTCSIIWYLNDYEIGRNDFQLNIKKEWDSVIFAQSFGSQKEKVWNIGQGRLEFYVKNFKVGEKYFGIGSSPAYEKDEKEETFEKSEIKKEKSAEKTGLTVPPPTKKSLNELLAELDAITGLENLKDAVKSFVSYLEFLKERKRLGLKSEDKISINAVFLGNPGTGKTTVARMLGDIFYAMGILPNGHVVEVDRAALVGQYIGETAQKTEKLINDAIGGVLFIDEAYSLVKKGGMQDFGQEAIDILLKRMEDRKGEFVVIAAGYPSEMETFLNSNPGLKSRFTQTFLFEDYTPDELMTIFKGLLKKEDYNLSPDAEELLQKEFISLYRSRDKSFGNARLVRRLFEDSKRNLSKLALEIPEHQRSKELITTFSAEVISSTLSKRSSKIVSIPINEEALSEAVSELNSLVGLGSVKKEINDMIKLARYFSDKGEDIKKIFNDHLLFLGNPGTGKTTVARIFAKIYSALGILAKGHLVETDRQGLVAGYVGQTAEKTTTMIDKSLGGVLFIDEAYTLIKANDSGNDFGKESIDILLKRMEDDRGKFIVISAGYTDEMNRFVSSNPGIQSRFSKSFTFEDYAPAELMEIVRRTLLKEKKTLTKEAEEKLAKHFENIYKSRDKRFGNARVVRNILDSVRQKMLLRISDLPAETRNEENLNTIEIADIDEVLSREIEAKQFEVQGDPLRLQEYIDELNKLIGLDNVKKDIYKLISFSKISILKKEKGLQSVDRNLHSIFIGNPGTGKRTVAKLMSRIFKELGILSKGHLLEVERSDLVAGYQDQTSIKTDKIIQQALDGTLLINDAQTLFSKENSFGLEALEIILKRMKDYGGRLFVILSGKAEEMNLILKANPGLSAYFPNLFTFEDYSAKQLLSIAADLGEKNGYSMDEGALQEFHDLFDTLLSGKHVHYQNGNLAKNILYAAITNQEERIFNIFEQDDVDLRTITLEDVQKIKR